MATNNLNQGISLSGIGQELGVSNNTTTNGFLQVSLNDSAIRMLSARTRSVSFRDLAAKTVTVRAQIHRYIPKGTWSSMSLDSSTGFLRLWYGGGFSNNTEGNWLMTHYATLSWQYPQINLSGYWDAAQLNSGGDLVARGGFTYLLSSEVINVTQYAVLAKLQGTTTIWKTAVSAGASGFKLAVDGSGNCWIVSSDSTGITIHYVNSSGIYQWRRFLQDSRYTSNSNWLSAPQIATDSAGNLIMVAFNSNFGNVAQTRRLFVAKFANTGSLTWLRSWASTTGDNMSINLEVTAVRIGTNDTIWIAGTTGAGYVFNANFLVQLASTGDSVTQSVAAAPYTFSYVTDFEFDDQSQIWVHVDAGDTRGNRGYLVYDLSLNFKRWMKHEYINVNYGQKSLGEGRLQFSTPYMYNHISRSDGVLLERLHTRYTFTATVSTQGVNLPPNRNSAIRGVPDVAIDREPYQITEYSTSTVVISKPTALFQNLNTSAAQFTITTTSASTATVTRSYMNNSYNANWGSVLTDVAMNPSRAIQLNPGPVSAWTVNYAPSVGVFPNRSAQGGANYVSVFCVAVNNFNKTLVFRSIDGGFVYSSTDFGSRITVSGGNSDAYYPRSVNKDWAIIVGRGFYLPLYSTDNGATWTNATSVPNGSIIGKPVVGYVDSISSYFVLAPTNNSIGSNYTVAQNYAPFAWQNVDTGLQSVPFQVGWTGLNWFVLAFNSSYAVSPTSQPGTWTTYPNSSGAQGVKNWTWGAAAQNKSYFVAIDLFGQIWKATVTTGILGDQQISQWSGPYTVGSNLFDVAYNYQLDIFMLVGLGQAYTSPDGVTWTDVTRDIQGAADIYWMTVEPITNDQDRNGFVIGCRNGVLAYWMLG